MITGCVIEQVSFVTEPENTLLEIDRDSYPKTS